MDAVIASVTGGFYAGAVTLIKAGTKTSALGPDEPDWTNPVQIATGNASISGLDDRAAAAAGILAAQNLLRCITTLTTEPTPQTTRLQANGVTYDIVRVRPWGSFYDLYIQEVT